MGNFFAELKRRHMYRVAAAYAVVAWVLLQLVNNLAPGLNLPNWAITLVIVLLAVGLPVALLFCWIQHMAPADGAAQQTRTNRLDWILAGGLAAVIGIFLFQQFAPNGIVSSQPTGADAARSASASPVGAISVAVLPFTNLSSDTEQEFFSDGMTEEITAALARVPGLVVIGRTSAFQFKGQNRDLRMIGQELGTTHLIEGSVRKAGNRVRITAQLIRADNGAHLWAENYDRDLTDVFAIQENIAQAIAGSLSLPLGLHQGDSIVRSRTTDPGAYEDYLRAKTLLRARGGRSVGRLARSLDGVNLAESVLARDPNFAPAWGLLGLAHALSITSQPAYLSGESVEEARRVVNDTFIRAESAAQRAIQLDPNQADAYFTLGRLQVGRGKLVQAEALYLKGLALDPSNPDGLLIYGNLLGEVARLKEALAIKRKMLALDPITGAGDNTAVARMLWLNSEIDEATEKLKTAPREVQDRAPYLAELYAASGRYREAADALMEIPPGVYPQEVVRLAAETLRRAPAVADALPRLPPQGRFLNFVYLHVGATDRVLEWHERNVELGWSTAIDVAGLWHPSYAQVRKTERFKALMRNVGLVEYWRAKGWPEFCHPTTGDDFECT